MFPNEIDLLPRMLDINPDKRFSAAECLKHQLFKSVDLNKTINIDLDDDLKNISKNRPKPDVENSFVIRDGVINGETKTINETNSVAGINSFKNMDKKGGKIAVKRESIYRAVLLKEGKDKKSEDGLNDSVASGDSEAD